jgi:AbrB family looped-hinge helix DNA binding protein
MVLLPEFNMVPNSTLTKKCQATIPKKIRSYLGLKPHDKIYFKVSEDRKVYMESMKKKTIEELAGKYHHKARKKAVTIAHMNKAIEITAAEEWLASTQT